jgi:hypothetical protein
MPSYSEYLFSNYDIKTLCHKLDIMYIDWETYEDEN